MLATRRRLSAALLATTAILGCAKHPPPPSPLHATPVIVLALPGDASERLARSMTMTKPLRGVIRNATAWSVFWARAREDDSAAARTGLPPDVDFSRECSWLRATDAGQAGIESRSRERPGATIPFSYWCGHARMPVLPPLESSRRWRWCGSPAATGPSSFGSTSHLWLRRRGRNTVDRGKGAGRLAWRSRRPVIE